MMHENYTHEPVVGSVKRISWGAIFAGVIIVLMVQITLSVIGIAVGLETVDPASEKEPMAGLGRGAMIWWLIAALLALFIGGWAASRMSAAWTRTNGMLHGIVMWGFVELLYIYLLTSAIGAIIGGAFGILESSLSGASKLIPNQAQAGQAGQSDDLQWQQIEKEVNTLLRQTGKPELSPEQLEQETEQAQQTARQTATDILQNPQQAYDEIIKALDKLLRQAKDVASEVDRQAVVNVLVERTNMTRQEAEKAVDRWVKTYQNASTELQQKGEQLKETAAQQAEEVGEVAADVLANAAWWSAAMLLLGACAAGIGGAIGIPAYVRDTHRKPVAIEK